MIVVCQYFLEVSFVSASNSEQMIYFERLLGYVAYIFCFQLIVLTELPNFYNIDVTMAQLVVSAYLIVVLFLLSHGKLR